MNRPLHRPRLRALLATAAFLLAPVGVAAYALPAHAAPGAAAEGALETFKARHAAVIQLVKRKAEAAALQAEVDKLLDYGWLARKSLGGDGTYEQNCGARCREFDALLTRLIRENYLRMIRKSKGNEVEYLGEVRGDSGDAYLVKTKLTLNKAGRDQIVNVNYVMRRMDGVWRVNDIITDDVSLAKTYRYEFNKIMKSGGIDGVLQKLEEKLASIDGPR